MERKVRRFDVEDVRRYAQHDRTVTVMFVHPRERRSCFYTMKPDDTRYLTIEVDGQTVYDSRDDVPCDMEKWQASRKRFIDRPAMTINGRPF